MYLGIDLGTSGLKLLLLDAQHQIQASADAPLTLQRPQPAWSEQHPRDWWQALERAVAQLRAEAPQAWRQVRAIGLSGQMHGAVVLDAQDRVLRPAILWNDGRSQPQCLALERRVPTARRITGNLAMPGFTAPKLLWLREHEAELFAQIRRVLLPKDWLRLQLTGDAVSEMSDASGTLWLDVGRRRWSEAMLEACGLGLAQMPRLVEGSAASAFDWAARLTGSAGATPLAQQVAALTPAQRARAPLFLPYLSGERTPHNNPQASGVFVGLRAEHGAADLGYAVMEGVGFGLMDGLRAMGRTAPSNVPLALVGGGARSDAWAQLLASGLARPLHRPSDAHAAAALGAARLAWLADGGSEEQVCRPPPLAQAFEPDAALAQLLADRYPRFRALYPALQPFF